MNLRISLIRFLVILLAALPLLGIFAGQSSAATSRVAVIKSITGTVKVKKAGGSKSFTAFTKMSLNEGDVLTTESKSSAVLQFANGTSEDDKMTLSANTTITFSKLSDKKGTRTKVSMFNGSAWVDVKSIASKDDEFTLQTPTTVMGVRGTHLFVAVDKASGVTNITVAAGVVSAQAIGNSESHDVMPGDNALITTQEDNTGEITIAPVDLEELMEQSDKSIVEAIVAAAGEIVRENQEKLDQYFGEGTQNLDLLKSNVENLFGAIVDTAVKSGLISQERVTQLVAEAQAQTGVTIDLSKKEVQLTDEQKRAQEEQKKKEGAARLAAEQARKKAEEERRKNEELQKKLDEERKAREQENNKLAEEQKKKAQEEYEKQLSDAEKERFKQEQQKREQEQQQQNQPSPSNTNTGGNPGGGENPDGEDPDGEDPDGEDPDGENPDGEDPDGEDPDGEDPDGDPIYVDGPSFLDGWITTDKSGNRISWVHLSELEVSEDLDNPESTYPSEDSYPPVEFLQAQVSDEVDDIQMQLAFDDQNYSVGLYPYSSFMDVGESEPSLSTTAVTSDSDSKRRAERLGFSSGTPNFEEIKKTISEKVLGKVSETMTQRSLMSSSESEMPLPYATWNTSGNTDFVSIPDYVDLNEYVMVLVPKNGDLDDIRVAYLLIENGFSPLWIYLYDPETEQDFNYAQTGFNEFEASIDHETNEVYVELGLEHEWWPMDFSITADDNGAYVDMEEEYCNEYYDNECAFTLTWDPAKATKPDTNINVKVMGHGTETVVQNYTLTLKKTKPADLALEGLKVTYGTDQTVELYPYSNGTEFDGYIDDASVTEISIEPKLTPVDPEETTPEDLEIAVYFNGKRVEDPAHATLNSDWNLYYIVVKSDTLDLYQIYELWIERDYPESALSKIVINDKIYTDTDLTSFINYGHVSNDVTSINLTLTDDDVKEKWMLFDLEQWAPLEHSEYNSYRLELAPGYNAFLVYNTSDYYYYDDYEIIVYREPDPFTLQDLEIDFSESTTAYIPYKFHPDIKTYDIPIISDPHESLPMSVSVSPEFWSIEREGGYSVKAFVNGNNEPLMDEQYSEPIELIAGLTEVNVVVTFYNSANEEIGTTTYTLNFNRAKSSDSRLRYTVVDVPDTEYYDYYYDPDDTYPISVTQSVYVVPIVKDLHSTVTVNGELVSSEDGVFVPFSEITDKITIKVTAEDGTTTEYTVFVNQEVIISTETADEPKGIEPEGTEPDATDPPSTIPPATDPPVLDPEVPDPEQTDPPATEPVTP